MIGWVSLALLFAAPDAGQTLVPATTPRPVTKSRAFRLGPSPKVEIRRIVTLAPSLTDLLIALGQQDLIVGVTRYDDAPEVKDKPRVGGFADPDEEAVLAQKPDMVIATPSPGNKRPVERMAELGLPVLVVPLEKLSDVLDAARVVSDALDISEEGEALAQSFESRLQQVEWRARGRRGPRSLMVFGWEPLVVAGPDSFAGELLVAAGGENVVTSRGNAFITYDVERAMAGKPELILDASDVGGPTRERFLALPGLKNARVVKLTPSALRPGPKLIDALEEIHRAVRVADGGF